MLGERTPQGNGQDQILQSGNYCYSFIRVVSIAEIKIKPLKNHNDSYSNVCPNCIDLRTSKKEVCSAEVGALAPVFEKSASELKVKLKQKLLKCKSTVHIVIFNVRTLNRIGQQTELTASVAEHDIDIIYTQEQILSEQSKNKIPRYWQRMDIHLSICMKIVGYHLPFQHNDLFQRSVWEG